MPLRDPALPAPFYQQGHTIYPYTLTFIRSRDSTETLMPLTNPQSAESQPVYFADFGYVYATAKFACKYLQKEVDLKSLWATPFKEQIIKRQEALNASLKVGVKVFSKVSRATDVIHLVMEPINKIYEGEFERKDIFLTAVNFAKMSTKWWVSGMIANGVQTAMSAAGFATPAGYIVVSVYAAIIFKEAIYKPLSANFKNSHVSLDNALSRVVQHINNHIINEYKAAHPQITYQTTMMFSTHHQNSLISVDSRLDHLFPDQTRQSNHFIMPDPISALINPCPVPSISESESPNLEIRSNFTPNLPIQPIAEVKYQPVITARTDAGRQAIAKALFSPADNKQILSNIGNIHVHQVPPPLVVQAATEHGWIGTTSAPCIVEFRTNNPKGGLVNINWGAAGVCAFNALGYIGNELRKSDEIKALEKIQSRLEYYCGFNQKGDPRTFGFLNQGFEYVFAWGDLTEYYVELQHARDEAQSKLISDCHNFMQTFPDSPHLPAVNTLDSYVHSNLPTIEPFFYARGRADNSLNNMRKNEWEAAKLAEQQQRDYDAALARQNAIDSTVQSHLLKIHSSAGEQKDENVSHFIGYIGSLTHYESIGPRQQLINAIMSDIPMGNQSVVALKQNKMLQIVTQQLEIIWNSKLCDASVLEKLFIAYSLAGDNPAIVSTFDKFQPFCQHNISILRIARDAHPDALTIAEKIDTRSDKNILDDYMYGQLCLRNPGRQQEGIQRLEKIKQTLTNPNSDVVNKVLLENVCLDLAYAYSATNADASTENTRECLNLNPQNDQAKLLSGHQQLQLNTISGTRNARKIFQDILDNKASIVEKESVEKSLKIVEVREARYRAMGMDLLRSGLRHASTLHPNLDAAFKVSDTAYRLVETAMNHGNDLSKLGHISNFAQMVLVSDDLLKALSFSGMAAATKEHMQFGADALGLSESAVRHGLSLRDYSSASIAVAGLQVTRINHYVIKRIAPSIQKNIVYQFIREVPNTVYNDFYYIVHYPNESLHAANEGAVFVQSLGGPLLVLAGKVAIVAGATAYTSYRCHTTYQKAKENKYLYSLELAYQHLNLGPTHLAGAEKEYMDCKAAYPDQWETIRLGQVITLIKNDSLGLHEENIFLSAHMLEAKADCAFALSYKAMSELKLATQKMQKGCLDRAVLQSAAKSYHQLTKFEKNRMSAYSGLVTVYEHLGQLGEIQALLDQITESASSTAEEKAFAKTQKESFGKQIAMMWRMSAKQSAGEVVGMGILQIASHLQRHASKAKSASLGILTALNAGSVQVNHSKPKQKSIICSEPTSISPFWQHHKVNPLKQPDYQQLKRNQKRF